MDTKKIIFSISAMLALPLLAAASHPQNVTLPEVSEALEKASPGDTLKVAPGIYEDIVLKWTGRGAEGAPVVVIAEKPGETVVTGTSTLEISGEWLTVSSILFKDGTPVRHNGPLVQFRCGDSLARHCRLTDCVIDNYNAPRRDFQSSYVHLYGQENRVDHCSFTGKKSLGVTLTVMLNYDGCIDNRHSIDHNYFGFRPVYGSNGAETIRVGTSQQCTLPSRTHITDNVFYRCNGEVEVISIKSCENVMRGNVLYECEGVLALRHGDRNVVEDNAFIGNGRRNTGGVRIVGEGQIVRNNIFHDLAGTRFFSALALMNAVPNSLPNRYMQVRDITIEDNEFSDCASIEFGCGCDYERTLSPDNVVFMNNTISNPSLDAPYIADSDMSGFTFRGNRALLADGAAYPAGFRKTADMKLHPVPDRNSLAVGIGASWAAGLLWQADDECSAVSGPVVELGADDDVASAVRNAVPGTTIVLSDPLYHIETALEASVPMTIMSENNAELRFTGRKPDNFITICDGARLTVRGITFNGVLTPGRSLAKAGISTADDMLQPYTLNVEDCTFIQFGESGFIPVKGTKGTFGERVCIRGCRFEALSGDAVNYAAELDDKGRYNADDIVIEDCSFERILGLPVNIYRGGSDESTAGPYVYVRNCTFDDCCNKVRGSVIRIIGAQILEISGCSFKDSGRGGYCIRLDDAPWEKISISGLEFDNSGGIMSNRKIEL